MAVGSTVEQEAELLFTRGEKAATESLRTRENRASAPPLLPSELAAKKSKKADEPKQPKGSKQKATVHLSDEDNDDEDETSEEGSMPELHDDDEDDIMDHDVISGDDENMGTEEIGDEEGVVDEEDGDED